MRDISWVVPMEEILFEAPKKAILLGLAIWYRGLSFIDFSIIKEYGKKYQNSRLL
jgi:hypothetical protein